MSASSKTHSIPALAVVLCLSSLSPAQEPGQGRGRGQDQTRTRRSQRVVPMKEVEVVSPDGQVKLTVGSNPERLTWTVTRGDTAVIEPSRLDMRVDGYDLSSGVNFRNLESYTIDET